MTMGIPNFRGQRAIVLHPEDRNRDAILEQLERLGVSARARWPAEAVSLADVDVAFFDSDQGFDELFARPPGNSPVPLIATLGSEAPGRIEWTLRQRPSAYLLKPIGSTGVFSALSIAFHEFALRAGEEKARRRSEERLNMRGTVLLAAATLMRRYEADADIAFGMLRAESMRRRTTLEAVSVLVLQGKWLPMAQQSRSQRNPPQRKRSTTG
jgi:two-component system, response regulator / RNA-binding antiterminator